MSTLTRARGAALPFGVSFPHPTASSSLSTACEAVAPFFPFTIAISRRPSSSQRQLLPSDDAHLLRSITPVAPPTLVIPFSILALALFSQSPTLFFPPPVFPSLPFLSSFHRVKSVAACPPCRPRRVQVPLLGRNKPQLLFSPNARRFSRPRTRLQSEGNVYRLSRMVRATFSSGGQR